MAATAPLLHISIAEVGPEQLVHRADGWACGCGGVDAVLLETAHIVQIVRPHLQRWRAARQRGPGQEWGRDGHFNWGLGGDACQLLQL
jgi:hypothetical protein